MYCRLSELLVEVRTTVGKIPKRRGDFVGSVELKKDEVLERAWDQRCSLSLVSVGDWDAPVR